MIEKYSLKEITDYIQKLEKRVKTLESKEALIIQGSLKTQNIKPLYINETKLIDIYNDVPDILQEYAVAVSIHEDSYRQLSLNKITLKKNIQGSYWVILLEQNNCKNYYLIPNGKKQIRFNKLQTIKYLFLLTGDDSQNNIDTFILEKPTILEILPSGLEWNLKEKGQLRIGKESKANKLMGELEKIVDKNQEFPKELEKLMEILEKVNQNNFEIKQEINLLKKRISQIEPGYINLVDLYNHNISEFKKLTNNDKKMKVTDNTQNTILQGLANPVSLEFSFHGEYILKQLDQLHYLFPDPSIIFDRSSLNIINQGRLFIIQGEIPIAVLGKDIKLEKPAQLRKKDNLWVVIEPGKITLD